jgi:hypothetical protein
MVGVVDDEDILRVVVAEEDAEDVDAAGGTDDGTDGAADAVESEVPAVAEQGASR